MHAPKRPRLRGGLSSDAGLEIPPAQLSTRSVDVLHSLLPSRSFKCSHPGCTRVLRDLAGLKRHVTRIHGGGSASLVFDVSRGELDLADSDVSRTEQDQDQDQQQCALPEQFASFDEDRRRSAGKISISSGLDRLDTSGDRVGSMLQSAAPINQVSEDKGPVDVNGVRYSGGDVDILRHWRHRSIVLQRMWSKDGDPTRDWRGVTFEQSRADAFIRDRVTDIELDDTGLTGVIPVELAHLDALRTVSMRGNGLTSMPFEIGQCALLRNLRLSNNNLREIPRAVGDLVNLEQLWLGGNKLAQCPKELSKLRSLRVLELSNNELISMPAEIGDMPTLNAVFLNNNRRLLTVPHSFGEAMKRGVGVLLDIHTRVLEAAEAQIGNWSTPGPGGEDARALRTVRERWQCDDLRNRVWNDPVSDPLTWKGVGVCNGRVTLLSLTGEKLTGMVPPEISQLSFLRVLSLGGNKLSALPPEFNQLRLLEELELFGNELTTIDLTGLNSLRRLDLYGNRLRAFPESMHSLQNLASVMVWRNPIREGRGIISDLRAAGVSVYVDDEHFINE